MNKKLILTLMFISIFYLHFGNLSSIPNEANNKISTPIISGGGDNINQFINNTYINNTYYTIGLNYTHLSNFTNDLYPNVTEKRQSINLISSVNTTWTDTNFNFTLSSGKIYNLECIILFNGSATSTGQAIALNTTSAVSDVVSSYETWSSATASVSASSYSLNTRLVGTGSGAGIVKQNVIMADFQASTSGQLNIRFQSELSAYSYLMRGSKCTMIEW